MKQRVHIEDTTHWSQCLRRSTGTTVQPPPCWEDRNFSASEGCPYPCSHPGCHVFHQNYHGFCERHAMRRFKQMVNSFLSTAWQGAELALLFSTQAFLEANSRLLATFIILSLYPVSCMMVVEASGTHAGIVVLSTLLLLFASIAHTSARFGRMRGGILKLCVATEASYFQVLDAAGLSVIFEELGDVEHSQGPSVRDLRSNYMEAKRRWKTFQKLICDPMSDFEGLLRPVRATLKLPTEAFRSKGSECMVDLLYCEVLCDSIRDLKGAWSFLQDVVARSAGSARDVIASHPRVAILAVRDDFVVFRGRRCGQVVLDVDGYRATVFFVEANLARLETELGEVCRLAENIGLLDDVKPQNWEVAAPMLNRQTWLQRASLFILRFFAGVASGYFCQGHFRSAYNKYESSSLFEPEVFGVIFSLPFFVLVLAFTCDLPRVVQWREPREHCSTWVVYEKYFGVQGRYYVPKVAFLQALSVGSQALGKLRAVAGAATLRMLAIEQIWAGGFATLHSFGQEIACYWMFMTLLALNTVYPNILLFFPHQRWARFTASLMDLLLDVGYMSIWITIFFWSGMIFQFPVDFFGYTANYFGLARMLGVCRTLESATKTREEEFAAPKVEPRTLRRLVPWYSTSIFVFLLVFHWSIGNVYPTWTPNQLGDCPPCSCTRDGEGLRLESCAWLGTVGESTFQLWAKNISSIAPGAFRDVVSDMLVLNLDQNKLTSLPPGLLAGAQRLRYLNLAHNQLMWLPPDLLAGLVNVEEVYFQGNKITSVPPGLFNGLNLLRGVELHANKITSLPPDIFRGLTGLEHILLYANQLTSLPPDLFTGLTGLQNIVIDNNQLTSLPPDLFRGLTGLRDLRIHNNQLTSLPPDLFRGLTGLRELGIHHNQLTSLPPDLFRGLTGLQKIDIHNNQLTSLPPDLFRGLTGLRDLRIHNNQLTSLPPDLFRDLTKLEQIHLADNQLPSLPPDLFSGLPRLDYLGLHGNSLTWLSQHLFRGLTELTNLRLDGNNLTALPLDVFGGLIKLRRLSLHWNQLTSVSLQFAGLDQLEYLNVAQNQLLQVSPDLLRSKGRLKELYLHENRLTSLPAGVFDGLTALQTLHLYKNQLSELDGEIFAGLINLDELRLDNNTLSSLPSGLLAGLAKLRYVDLSSNNLTTLPVDFCMDLSLERLELTQNQASLQGCEV